MEKIKYGSEVGKKTIYLFIVSLIIIIFGVVVIQNTALNAEAIDREDISGQTQFILLDNGTSTTISPIGEGVTSSSFTRKNQTWLDFDGDGDYVEILRTFDFDNPDNNFSICFDFKRNNLSTYVLLDQRDGFNDGWVIQFNGNLLEIRLNTTVITTNQLIKDTDWHNACVVINRNGNSSIYIDDNRNGDSINTAGITMSSSQNIFIGKKAYLNSDYFNGSMKNISLFNRTIAKVLDEVTFVNPTEHLNITTYDGSNQTIHPSVLYFDTPWNGYNYWMGNTPFPEGDSNLENPSIFYCNDTLYDCNSNNATWINSTINPINKTSCQSFCSDIDIVYNSDNDFIYAYYRKWNSTTNISTEIRQNSSDGSTWSDELIIGTQNKTIGDIDRSCVYIYRSSTFWERFCQNEDVNSDVIYYNSTDGITWNYNSSIEDNVFYDTGIWHLEIDWIAEKNKYFMFFYSTTAGNLYFAETLDNNPLNWRFYFPTEIMDKSNWNSRNLYKPSFLYNKTGEDRIDLWFGGQNSTLSSFTGYSNYTYDSLKNYLIELTPNKTGEKLIELKLQENSALTAHDTSGNGNNGTITGASWNNDGIDVALTENTDYTLSGSTFTIINDLYAWTGVNASWNWIRNNDTRDSNVMHLIEIFLSIGILSFVALISYYLINKINDKIS